MELLKELQANEFDIFIDVPLVYYKAFKDTAGTLEMAKTPKICPRTRHIVNKVYHHFRDWVRQRTVTMYPISTTEQLVDLLTKPLAPIHCVYLRKKLLGW